MNRTINFCLVEDLPTLIWVANLASLELHTALHRAVDSKGTPDETWTPDMVVFDLVRHAAPAPLRVWMDCGRYEDLLEGNQRMYALMRERGSVYPVGKVDPLSLRPPIRSTTSPCSIA